MHLELIDLIRSESLRSLGSIIIHFIIEFCFPNGSHSIHDIIRVRDLVLFDDTHDIMSSITTYSNICFGEDNHGIKFHFIDTSEIIDTFHDCIQNIDIPKVLSCKFYKSINLLIRINFPFIESVSPIRRLLSSIGQILDIYVSTFSDDLGILDRISVMVDINAIIIIHHKEIVRDMFNHYLIRHTITIDISKISSLFKSNIELDKLRQTISTDHLTDLITLLFIRLSIEIHLESL